jgi:hypothetical protein
MANEFEIMKLIADFIIVLISITIPTYAIAISFLGKEYSKTLKKIIQCRQTAEKKLDDRIKSKEATKLEDFEESIEEFRKKERDLRNQIKPLSLWRTLALPNAFFGAALVISALAMYLYPSDVNLLFTLVIIFIVSGLIIYGWVLNGIQKIAQELEEEIM